MMGILKGRNFCLGERHPLLPPVVAALLIRICPDQDNISGRKRISTGLQYPTTLLSYAKCFVIILLRSVALNLLYSIIGMALKLNLSNQLE